MWVICDDTNCFHFSSDDNGRLFRASTPISSFPAGMSEPVIAIQGAKNDVFEASNVYNIGNSTFLLIIEAIGSDGNRYFRSWTSSKLDGAWVEWAATEANPFARSNNVVFEDGNAWTKSISHGEAIRTNVDEKMMLSPCGIRYLYQGMDPGANVTYNALPWKLGLLTQTNNDC